MGLFRGLKKQLLKVIEWQDNTKDTIVYRYPLTDRDEIMNSSTLVVRPSQVALFVHKGQICEVFAPGTYKLSTENIPIITKILSLPTGFDSPIKAEVYYVNTKQFTGWKWGTQNPIMLRDADFGAVRIRAFGAYAFKVEDAQTFMKEMFGTNEIFKVEDLVEQVKPMVIQGMTDAVAESKISALDLAANYREFSQNVMEASQEELSKFGLKLTSFIIENISLPQEVEEALDQRTKLGMFSDKMGTYTQLKAADALEAAAKNPNGNNFAGMGVGLGAGVGLGQVFSQSLSSAQDAPIKTPQDASNNASAQGTKTCPSCGSTIPNNVKFCPECGEKLPAQKFCTNCGTKLSDNAKFCPECGTKQ